MSFKSQPKFKFGDKVREEGGSPFVVSFCLYEDGVCYYGEHWGSPMIPEERLTIYEEPKQPRKMLAFINYCTGYLYHALEGSSQCKTFINDKSIARAEGFDLIEKFNDASASNKGE